MKRWLYLGLLVFVLAACGGDGPAVHEGTGDTVQDEPLSGTITRVTIDGMPCLVWENHRGSGNTQFGYSGLTCDWSAR